MKKISMLSFILVFALLLPLLSLLLSLPGMCMRLRNCGKRAAERCSLSDGHPGGR